MFVKAPTENKTVRPDRNIRCNCIQLLVCNKRTHNIGNAFTSPDHSRNRVPHRPEAVTPRQSTIEQGQSQSMLSERYLAAFHRACLLREETPRHEG